MKGNSEIEAALSGDLDSFDVMAVTASETAGGVAKVGGVSSRPSRRIRAITVLVNNSDYLSWALGRISSGMSSTAKELGPLNPMKLPLVAMTKLMRHPNAWKLIVSQIGRMSDEDFDTYWPDISGLVQEIDTDSDPVEETMPTGRVSE